MEVNFFERNPAEGQISIEKLFSVIKKELGRKNIICKTFINPYPLSKFYNALAFFRKNQGEITHITGDIHWAALVLNPKKTVLTVHDLSGLYQYKGIKRFLYYLIWIYFPFTRLRYITVISEKTKREIEKLLPSVAHKLKVIPNCITVDVSPLAFKKDIQKTNILIVGTRSNKNIERIFEACRDLNATFSIVGSMNATQKQLINTYHLKCKNHVNISDDDLKKLYDESDILCFPSLYEGFGLPILEAQARNCIVITSNLSPMNDVAGNGALLIDPYSTESIKNSIIKVLSDDELRKDLITKGQENVKKYIPELVAQQYIELYQKIKAGK